MEQEAVNRKDEGRRFLQTGRAQVMAGINYKYKGTHQRRIPEEVIRKAERIKLGLGLSVIKRCGGELIVRYLIK